MVAYSGESLQTFTEMLSSNVSTWWNQNGGTDNMSPGASTAVYAETLSSHEPSYNDATWTVSIIQVEYLRSNYIMHHVRPMILKRHTNLCLIDNPLN